MVTVNDIRNEDNYRNSPLARYVEESYTYPNYNVHMPNGDRIVSQLSEKLFNKEFFELSLSEKDKVISEFDDLIRKAYYKGD